MKRVVLIYTVKSVLDSFEGKLRAAIKEELAVHNTFDDYLATDAGEKGEFTQDNLNRLFYILKAAELTKPDAIVVTCSTLTPAVCTIRPFIGVPVIAIDDAMTKKAVTLGDRITIMATAQSTVEPTTQKLLHDAKEAGKEINIKSIVCPEAIAALKKGDKARHDELLRKVAAENLARGEIVVLAQASMAHMQQEIERISGCPTLSSPDLCVAQTKELLFGHNA